jgi:hypothetical protein
MVQAAQNLSLSDLLLQSRGEMAVDTLPAARRASQRGAEAEWQAAIAALTQLLATLPRPTQAKEADPAQKLGLVLSGPLPVITAATLMERFTPWVVTPQPLAEALNGQRSLLPAAHTETTPALPPIQALPLSIADPLLTERFCLVVTATFRLALVLGQPTGSGWACQYSFDPTVVNTLVQRVTAAVVAVGSPHITPLLQHLNTYPSTPPDYRLVAQFSQGMVAHLPHRNHPETQLEVINVPGGGLRLAHWHTVSEPRQSSHGQTAMAWTSEAEVPPPGPDAELLQAMAHEIRTPLTTIRTLTRSLLRRQDVGGAIAGGAVGRGIHGIWRDLWIIGCYTGSMNRRTFSKLAGGMAMAAAGGNAFAAEKKADEPFKALFAPHPNQFPGGPKDYIEQLQLAYDLGFRAWEDNGLGGRPADLQEKVGQFMKDKKMTIGVMVISGGNGMHFAKPTDDGIKQLEANMKRGVEVSKRTGQTWMTMIPGIRVDGMPLDDQIKGAVDVMKRCCDIIEEHGVIMVLEPLSHGVKGGPPLLRSFMDGFKLCELVNRKSLQAAGGFLPRGDDRQRPDPERQGDVEPGRVRPVRRCSRAQGTRHREARLRRGDPVDARAGVPGRHRDGARREREEAGRERPAEAGRRVPEDRRVSAGPRDAPRAEGPQVRPGASGRGASMASASPRRARGRGSESSKLRSVLEGHRPRCPRVAGQQEPRGQRSGVLNLPAHAAGRGRRPSKTAAGAARFQHASTNRPTPELLHLFRMIPLQEPLSGIGRITLNDAPPSGDVPTVSVPSCFPMIPWLIASPSPSPKSFPRVLVVKLGSKISFRISSGTPGPESSMVTSIVGSGSSTSRARTRMVPPFWPPIASQALTRMFVQTC